MKKHDVKARVISCLMKNGIVLSPIKDNKLLFTEIVDDSFKIIKFVIDLENEFNIELDWEEVDQDSEYKLTLDKLVDYIQTCLRHNLC
jgi:acyl carrier protein